MKCRYCNATFSDFETSSGLDVPLYCPFCGQPRFEADKPVRESRVWSERSRLDFLFRRPHERVSLAAFKLVKMLRSDSPKFVRAAWGAVALRCTLDKRAIGVGYELRDALDAALKRTTKLEILDAFVRDGMANGIVYREWLDLNDA